MIEPRAQELNKQSLWNKAHRLGKSAEVERALKEELKDKGLNNEDVAQILSRNANQNKSISASNQALDIAIKVRGEYAPEKQAILQVFGDITTPAQEQDALRTLIKELTELTNEQ